MEHLTEQEIAQCADALISGKYDKLPSGIKEHLAVCNTCAGEVSVVAGLVAEVGSSEKEQKTPSRKRRWWIVALTSAAASLALFFIGNYYLNNPQQIGQETALHDNAKSDTSAVAVTPDESISISEKENPKKAAAQQKNLLAYAPHADLEKLANNFKGAYRGGEVSVITPQEFTCSPTDSIQWNNKEKIQLSVEFYNNQGAKISTMQTAGNSIVLPHLAYGLYYWKLINDDFDLLFCGKLIVE